MARIDYYRDDWNPYGTTDATTTFGVRYPEMEVSYEFGRPQEIMIRGQLITHSAKISDMYYGKENKPTMHPGTLTLADADGNAITIEPTGKNGYTVHTTPEPVRVNSKMDDALRGHASRCLSYAKPKPVAELES